ncbi:MAG: hypothetical protein ACREC0_13865 [Methylocella sp.]
MAILEAKLVIAGDDRAGVAFKAVEAKIDKIGLAANKFAEVAGTVGGIGAKANEAAMHVDRMSQGFGTISLKVDEAHRKVRAFSSSMEKLGIIAKIAGGFIAGAFAIESGKVILAPPFERASERVKQQVTRMTPAEISGPEAKSEVERKYPSVGTTNVQHMMRL